MSFIDFESAREKEKKRQWEREARDAILEKAKNKYEAQKLQEEVRRQRGEHTWMLPSVEAKLDSEKLDKKKKKKKDKKKKKKKKKKKDSSSSSSSESDEESETWVEKPATTVPSQSMESNKDKTSGSCVQESQKLSQETSKRDGWMEMTSLFKTYSRNEVKEIDGNSRKMAKEEEKRRKQEADKPGSHARELNPYFKNGGTGLPEEEKEHKSSAASQSSSVGLDASWLRKALQRAKEQAQLEKKTLEEIAAQRWGSLSKFNELLAEAEGRGKAKDENTWQKKNAMWKGRDDSRTGRERRWGRAENEQRSRSKDRKRSGSRDRKRSRSRDRKRSGSRDRKRSGSRDRKRSGSRDRKRSRSSERKRSKSSERKRYRSRERSKERSRHSRSRSKERGNRGRSIDRLVGPGGKDKTYDRRHRRDDSTSSGGSSDSNSDSESSSSSNSGHHGSKKNRSQMQKKYSHMEGSHRVTGLMKPPVDDCSTQKSSVLSSRFHKPGDEIDRRHGMSFSCKRGSSSNRGWQKKEHVQEDQTKRHEKPKSDSSSCSSSSSSSSSEAANSDEEPTPAEELGKMATVSSPVKTPSESPVFLTDKEMNELAAKIMKAELMGNDNLASKLKSKLEAARTARASGPADSRGSEDKQDGVKEQVVILTRTDAKGFSRPVSVKESGDGRKKKGKMMITHGKDGKRTRYFPDDDKHDLKQMFEEEKCTTAEDQNAMFNRAAMQNTEKLNDDYDMDDMFMSKAIMKENSAKQAERDKKRAIQEHRRSERSLESCRWCFDNKEMAKHLIVALGTKAYVCLPPHESLTSGHCLIVPVHHVMCSVQADEDLWAEVMNFRKSLVRMFLSRGEDCIFFETAKRLRNYPHMVINCVPLPKEIGDMAPIYFKKAIMECEAEWAQNKKLVDLKNRDVRRAVPKGLPYFFVDFAMDAGFAHVIEDEQDFPHNFAQEIVGGMLDLDTNAWRKPRKENFDTQRRKVMEFSRWYKEFDITQDEKE